MSGHKENKIAKTGVHITRSRFVEVPIIDEYPPMLKGRVVEMREALVKYTSLAKQLMSRPTSRYGMNKTKWIWANYARSLTIQPLVLIVYLAI